MDIELYIEMSIVLVKFLCWFLFKINTLYF